MYPCYSGCKLTYIIVAQQRQLCYASTGGTNERILRKSKEPAGPIQAAGSTYPGVWWLCGAAEPPRGRQITARYGRTTLRRAVEAHFSAPGGHGQCRHDRVRGRHGESLLAAA